MNTPAPEESRVTRERRAFKGNTAATRVPDDVDSPEFRTFILPPPPSFRLGPSVPRQTSFLPFRNVRRAASSTAIRTFELYASRHPSEDARFLGGKSLGGSSSQAPFPNSRSTS
ncbi:hypothetical protein KM043_002930 [Ampulex compressa]|nr:hypothetical protein KM043_002930 [Ampulex compressa]